MSLRCYPSAAGQQNSPTIQEAVRRLGAPWTSGRKAQQPSVTAVHHVLALCCTGASGIAHVGPALVIGTSFALFCV